MDLDRSTVLMSIRPIYVARILAGTKTMEFRRKPLPDQVETVLIWRTSEPGRGAGIVGKFDMPHQRADAVRWFTGEPPFEHMSPACGVTAENLIRYAGGIGATVWALSVRNVTRFQRSIPGPALHPDLPVSAPMSWRYAPTGWETKVDLSW
jgi:predicted transcriptional regulator